MFENHFWSIGFQIKSAEEYQELALTALKQANVVARRPGYQYECWSLGNIELWLQTKEGTEKKTSRIIDLSPHYAGNTRLRAQIRGRVTRKNDDVLDRAYRAVAGDDGYPFVLDVPFVDPEPETPSEATLQITAFAHSLDVFEDETTYDKQREPGKGWASRSFVPCGMFEPSGAQIDPPKSTAIFAGIVQRAAQEVNPHTGKSFQWAAVSSYLADYDIVGV